MRVTIYRRRSYKREDAADVSDEQQEASCRRILPPDAVVTVLADSGGHNSGFDDRRDGYRELIRRIRAGLVDAVAVYDLSRLARNTGLMLALRDELDRHAVALYIATMPGIGFDGAAGRFMFTAICAAAQMQRDMDSEKQRALHRSLFEDGRHRGADPFGYRSRRDGARIAQPRTLGIHEPEAAIVRRVFDLAAHSSTEMIAATLNAEGVRGPRGGWTGDAVKTILRRAEVYLGNVSSKRGTDVRPGLHEPIITEGAARAARIGTRDRFHAGPRPKPFRVYPLSGLIFCACGRRLEGQTRVARGREWRYYLCRDRHAATSADEAKGDRPRLPRRDAPAGPVHRPRPEGTGPSPRDPGRSGARQAARSADGSSGAPRGVVLVGTSRQGRLPAPDRRDAGRARRHPGRGQDRHLRPAA
jgi:site-specific DNA recombinase